MTTTLRPAGPAADGRGGDGRAGPQRRVYDICVNGRRAGGVELSAADEHGLRTGRIARLAVEEADRRRGRATVAVLAAEEVLRGWGCTRVAVAVPAAAEPSLRLAASLGYTGLARHQLKDLPALSERGMPPGSRLDPLTGDAYSAWRIRDRERFAAGLTTEGLPPERAAEAAERAEAALLPDGSATSGMSFHTLIHDGAGVGTLWLQLDGAPRPDAEAWVYSVEVDEYHRGRGHGRTLMRVAEDVCRAAGRRVLGLNVHERNSAARSLYASLGYRTVEHHLGKSLL